MSTLDKLRQLDAERTRLIEEVKEHTLGEIEEHLKTLNDLGFNYTLVENAPKKRKRRTKAEMAKA